MDRRTALGVLLAGVAAAAQPRKGAQRTARNYSKAQGFPSAPATVEVFSDYQCPACAALHLQTIKPLTVDYVRKGSVYLVNRDFPLAMHPYSRQAALLATAAAGISRFEVVADAFFRKQSVWSADGKLDAVLATVLSPAESKTVQELAATPEVAKAVEQDVALGTQAGINQTPTLFVMHGAARYPFSGAVAYQMLRQVIDLAIKK